MTNYRPLSLVRTNRLSVDRKSKPFHFDRELARDSIYVYPQIKTNPICPGQGGPDPPVLCPDPTRPKPIYGGTLRGPYDNYDDACKLALMYTPTYWSWSHRITGQGDHCYTWWSWDPARCDWVVNMRLHWKAPQCPLPEQWIPLRTPKTITRPPPRQAPSFSHVY